MEKDIIKEYYKALEQNRIKAYFQPMYTTNGFSIASAEVLCRMILPDGKIVLPEDYIQRLEYTGEICSLDWHMVKEACSALSEMRYRIGRYTPLSVNLSRRHVEEWNTAEHLCSIVDSYALEHEVIEVEITETYKGHDLLLKEMIGKIREKGFPVAIDDFGSGYATFDFIRDIDFDTLKIDRSFLKGDIDDDKTKALIAGVIGLAKKLGARTVVEGVENAAQLSYLNCCGCTLLQGNFLNEPLPEERFLDLMEKQEEMKKTSGQ